MRDFHQTTLAWRRNLEAERHIGNMNILIERKIMSETNQFPRNQVKESIKSSKSINFFFQIIVRLRNSDAFLPISHRPITFVANPSSQVLPPSL